MPFPSVEHDTGISTIFGLRYLKIREARAKMLRINSKVKRPWCLTIGLVIIVVIIIVIVVPLAVILPGRGHAKGQKSTVLFPLYIYPVANSTWNPLYKA
jgi:hypothetical protein